LGFITRAWWQAIDGLEQRDLLQDTLLPSGTVQQGLDAADYTRFAEESRIVLPSSKNYATIGASKRAKTFTADDHQTSCTGEDYAHLADCHEPSQTTQ
jgi:hypothetical protein